jgi:hypothetical protein
MTQGSPSTSTRTETTTFQIVVPADPRVLRVLRLVASGVASLGEFDLDAVEEVRVAVDELGSALIAAGDGAPLSLTFELGHDKLCVEGTTDLAAARELQVDPLTDRILDAVTTAHSWASDDGTARCHIEKALTPQH